MKSIITLCFLTMLAFASRSQVSSQVPKFLTSKDANYGICYMLGTKADHGTYDFIRKYMNDEFTALGMHIGANYFFDSAMVAHSATAMDGSRRHFSDKLVNVRVDLRVASSPSGKKLADGKADIKDFRKVMLLISIFVGTEPYDGTFDAASMYTVQNGSDIVTVMEGLRNDIKNQPKGYFLPEGGVPVYKDYEVFNHFPKDLDKNILAVVTYSYPLAGLGSDRYPKIMEDYPFPYELVAPEAWEKEKSKYKYSVLVRDNIRRIRVRYSDGEKKDKANQDFYFLIQDVAKGDIYMGEKEFKPSEGMGGALKAMVERVNEEFGTGK